MHVWLYLVTLPGLLPAPGGFSTAIFSGLEAASSPSLSSASSCECEDASEDASESALSLPTAASASALRGALAGFFFAAAAFPFALPLPFPTVAAPASILCQLLLRLTAVLPIRVCSRKPESLIEAEQAESQNLLGEVVLSLPPCRYPLSDRTPGWD